MIACRLDEFRRPYLDVILKGRNGPLPAEATLLDTGSDASLFPERLMAPLGVNRAECWEEETQSQLETGTRVVLRTNTTIHVEVARTFQIPVLAAFSADVPSLLGVLDFFRWFRFVYDPAASRAALQPHPDTPLRTRSADSGRLGTRFRLGRPPRSGR